LVISVGIVDGVSVTEVGFFDFTLTDFVFEENWVFIAEKRFIVIAEQDRHRSRIETHNRCHIGSVQLQECLVENGWLRLSFHQLIDIRHRFADIDTLQHHQLSKRDRVNLDLEQVFKLSFIIFIGIGVNLLNLNFTFFYFLVCEYKKVRLVQLQIAHGFERMDHSHLTNAILDWPFRDRAKGENHDTVSVDGDEVVRCVDQRATDL